MDVEASARAGVPRSPVRQRGEGDAVAPLLERAEELAAIDDVVAAAALGEGGAVLVEAAAGLGKSTLLAHAETSAAHRGLQVLRARGHLLARDHPFATVRGLFERHLAEAPDAEVDDLLSGAAAGARPVFAPPTAADAAAVAEGLFPILHGLVWLTSNLADRRPVLLAVDDLHWSDPSSLCFLLHLAGQVEDLPVALVATTRPAEPDAPEELLAQLRDAATVRCLRLAPLTSAGADRLVRERLPEATPAFRDACVGATGGNPFLLVELLTDLEQRQVRPDDSSTSAVEAAPASVHATVLARLWRLGRAAIAVARAVAVLGEDAHLRSVAALAEVATDEAASLCGSLAASQVLTDGEPLRFVHPLVAAAVHDDLPAAELAAAHHRAAHLLEADEAATERVAAHLLRADHRGDQGGVEVLRRAAAEAIAQGSPTSAVRYLRRALEEPPATPEARVAVLLELGDAEALTTDPGAIDRFEEALTITSDGRERAQVLLRLGRVLHTAGRMAEAGDVLKRGMDEVPPDDELLDELKAMFMATAWLDASHTADVEAWRREFLESPVERRARRAVLAQDTMRALFAAAPHTEVIDRATRLLADGALLEEEGPGSLDLWIAVGGLSWSDALPEAEAVIEAALADARTQGATMAWAQALYARSWPRYWRGRIDDAVADAQAAVAAWSTPGGIGMYLPAAKYWLALALIERDDVDAAAATLELPDAEERWGSTALYAQWRIALAHVADARGEWELALDHLRTAGAILTESFPWIVNPAPLSWRGPTALVARRTGDEDLARRSAAEELDLARRFGAPRPLAAALRVLGVVTGGDRGLDHLREAVAVLEGSPFELERCRCLIELGAALRRHGSRAQAREPLRRGLDIAQRTGARRLARRAEEELRATGARPRRRALTGPDALTPAERRTAELAGEGMTNREIAQSLFVTVKTVEWHLHNAYAKLQIESREELARALGR